MGGRPMRALPWLAAALLLLAGCGLVPRVTTLADPETKQLWDVAAQFPGEKYGFSPLPAHPREITIETHTPVSAYDRMLHINDRTWRSIAFKKTPQGYAVVHEQECYEGPNFYAGQDGQMKEKIWITYETVPIATSTPGVPVVDYEGADPKLLAKPDLKLADVLPTLKQWGY